MIPRHALHPRLTAVPAIPQLYWCDFPADAQLPELWKTRPIVIVRRRSRINESVGFVMAGLVPAIHVVQFK